jgi:hypothetical protein
VALLQAAGETPAEAQRRFEQADVEVELVWMDHGQGPVYQALLLGAGETVALGAWRTGEVPVPLRGRRDLPERVLLEVDGRAIPFVDALAALDLAGEDLARRILDRLAVREAARQWQIVVGDEPISRAVEKIRRTHGLFTRAETEAWLAARGKTPQDLLEDARRVATRAAVQEMVAGAAAVTARFAVRPSDFDIVVLALRACSAAAEDLSRLRADWWSRCPEVSSSWPALRAYRRIELPDTLARAAFDSAPGELVGPIPVGPDLLLARAVCHRPAALERDTAAFIETLLFEEWLAERRRHLRPRWLWGALAPDAG